MPEARDRKDKFSIGDMSRICNISRKALRYYDSIGLITPRRQDYNNYRCYTKESLLLVPVLKYYKQMGFTLDEMRSYIEGSSSNVYHLLQHSFLSKIDELQREREDLHRKFVSVKDWRELIVEAEMVLENSISEVSVKYVEPVDCLFQEQAFDGDLKAAIINIDFTNYVEAMDNEVTGPVILRFPSFCERETGECRTLRIMQKTFSPASDEARSRIGGCMMATCYHIGPHEGISGTYGKLRRWAGEHGYTLEQASYERYVTDYWTTGNAEQFVTELMVGVSRRGAAHPEGN